MADNDLDAIRQARLQQLQSQPGEGDGAKADDQKYVQWSKMAGILTNLLEVS